jgi:hypothetical protein
MCLEGRADRAHMHRTSVGLIVRGKRGDRPGRERKVGCRPEVSLSELVANAEAQMCGRSEGH